MRNKKDIEEIEKWSKEVKFPERDLHFDQFCSRLKLAVEANLGSLDDFYYNNFEGTFYIEKSITYRPLKANVWIQGVITSSVDPKRPLTPQFEEILKIYAKLKEESLENERNNK